jgi:CheY-like chemotaxis protein
MPSEKKQILVIDDDPDIVEVIKVVLESAGYAVETAGDGDTGMAKMRAKKPDLVILDVMMRKETEGFHVSYAIKNDPALAKIPILMLTAIGERTGMKFSPDKDGEYLPVEAFVEKPIEPNDLISRVQKLIAPK